MTTEKKTQLQQKRLMIVIMLSVGIFALRFGLLLSSAQKNLDYIANQLKTENIVIKHTSISTNTGSATFITGDTTNIE